MEWVIIIGGLMLFALGPALFILLGFLVYGIAEWIVDSIRLSFMNEEQKEAYKQRKREKAAKEAAGLAAVRQIEAESRMRKYQCPVCGYSSADNEFLDIYGKSTGECRCRKCGKRFYC